MRTTVRVLIMEMMFDVLMTLLKNISNEDDNSNNPLSNENNSF